MSETIYRQWVMLGKIPREPQTITAGRLLEELSDDGYETSLRTIQRDLNMLSSLFPISSESRERVHHWYWINNAAVQNFPGMDPATALTFKMVEDYLKPLLPVSTLGLLKPYFDQASNVFDNIPDNHLHDWPYKIAVIKRGIEFKNPNIKPEIQQVIYESLMREKQIDVMYRKRNAKEACDYRIFPLGLVIQYNVIYLVCAIKGRDNIRHLPLHRFESATILEFADTLFTIPSDFKLQNFLNETKCFQYTLEPDPIKLKILLQAHAATRLYETPVADDQELITQKDGRILLTATVANTLALRWWLLELGANVEVLEPMNLRDYFVDIVRELQHTYQVDQCLEDA